MKRPVVSLLVLALCAGALLATAAGAQTRPPLKPFGDVIKPDAKADPGVFTVYRMGDRVYYEIPAAALGREMLWSTEIAQLPAGLGYGGTAVGTRVVRWTRRENRIFLRDVSYRLRGDGKNGAIERAVSAASLEPIIMAFDIETEGKERSAVIEATRLLTSDVAEFSVKGALGASGVDPSRSYIEQVKSFPTNIEARCLLTFSPGAVIPSPFASRNRGDARSITALIHYSMVALPEKPMRARLFDARVGYFTQGFEDFGSTENRVVPREYVARYRLEKKDPNAELSEPVKPIVYYISREVPERWHPYIKKAVEDWNPAFEAAGFKNAISCKEAPTYAEDPYWDPEDARYSVIRWAPVAVQNAMGPHTHDPRTGEILSAHIIMWHDVLKLAETQYFVQVSPLDPQAQKLPLPEPLMGELLRYVTAHEVGHTLGLRHNHKASSSYTCAQLRNKEFTEKWGDEASIMDYGRMNYVAQPGDNVRLIPKLGPYDLFAIEWGYKAFPGTTTPQEEKPELDRIAARQVQNPMLRFGGEDNDAQVDPTVQTEDLGSDPIEATTYGLVNIARVAKLLIPATTRLGDDYSLLREMYDALLQQRSRELMHVVKLVGGVTETRYNAGRGGDVYKPVPHDKQVQAVQFLVDHALNTPKELLLPEILNRIEPAGASNRVLGIQLSIMDSLLGEARIRRIEDHQARPKSQSFTVLELVNLLQNGVWSELSQKQPAIDSYRQNLQRNYLSLMKSRLALDGGSQTSLRPIGVGALRDLAKSIDAALPKVNDRVTRLHLQESRKDIERIVNPKV